MLENKIFFWLYACAMFPGDFLKSYMLFLIKECFLEDFEKGRLEKFG